MKLSPTEFSVICSTDFFYTKAAATKKIDELLAKTRDELRGVIQRQNLFFPQEVDVSTGKIFKGENYLGLPYLNLDFPKYFSNDSVISCRTLFWWGRFFSFTLHLQGKALDERRVLLIHNYKRFRKKGIYFCVNNTPWQYYYKSDNYVLIDKFTESEIKRQFIEREFIKFSAKIELKDYRKVPAFAKNTFSILSFLFDPQEDQAVKRQDHNPD